MNIARTSPLYTKFIKDWIFYKDHYRGGREYLRKDYLKKYQYEASDLYEDRKKRGFYYNYSAPIIELFTSHIFKEKIERLNTERLNDFIIDCNNKWEHLQYFMQRICVDMLMYGHTFIFMDKPKIETKTVREEKLLKLKPYCFEIRPEKMIDWSLDRNDEPYYIKWIESQDDIKQYTDVRKDVKDNYRIWTRENWYLIDSEGNTLETGKNSLGYIPIVHVCTFKSEYTWIGESLIRDIAVINNMIYQWCSALDESIHKQMFAQLILESSRTFKDIGVGVSAYLKLDPAAQEKAYFIAPDVQPMEQVRKMIDEARQEIFRIASNQKEGGTESAQIESGISKAYDFVQTNRKLALIADALETAEMQLFNIYYDWEEMKNMKHETTVNYPDEFDMLNFSKLLQDALQLKAIQIPSKTFYDELYKTVAQKYLGKYKEDIIEKINKEIDTQMPTSQETIATVLGIK